MPQTRQHLTANTYEEIFGARASRYDLAMLRYPNARKSEFEQALTAAAITTGMVIADVPAGGGYLRRYLPDGCTWLGHEPCAGFADHHTSGNDHAPVALLPLPWPEGAVDVSISIAGVHHLEDKRPFFTDLMRVARPGGRFVLSDVAAASPQAEFLDHFVGRHNSTGHSGIYLDDTTPVQLAESGWHVVSDRMSHFSWQFDNHLAMAEFCHHLFDLRSVSCEKTIDAIERMLGTARLDDGRLGMRWALRTIVATSRLSPGA